MIARWARRGPSALAAATVLLVCVPQERDDLTTASDVTLADLASVALIATAAAALLPAGRRLPGRAWVTVPLVVAATAATLASQDVMASLPGLFRYLQVFVLIPLAVIVALRDRMDLWLVGGAVAGAALLQGAVGSWQALSGTGASYAGENIRAVGTFGATGVMGMATVTSYGLIVLLALGLALRGRRRAAALAAAALLAPALVLSLSRGTWLAVLCAALAILVVHGPRAAARAGLPVAAACVLFAGATALMPGSGSDTAGSHTIGQRISSIGSSITAPDRSVSDRYGLWEAAAGIWRDHPVTGAGPRRFPALRDSHAPVHLSSGSDTADPVNGFQRQPLLSPHNMYLLVLSEQGLVGVTAFCLFFGCLTIWSVRRAGRTRSFSGRAAGLTAVGFLTWQLTDFAYSDIGGPPTLVMSVMLGITLWWATAAGPRAGGAPAAPGAGAASRSRTGAGSPVPVPSGRSR
ncbi:O-antigen ligase family protein [Planomonospora sp. ID67723]|uniref:O-antigen ligase family protein n=1 Tax=Planomonospora sp. ID67723 TaxID=2738134 RepID=UPI0018C44957|nr:O-antigen ligase family protein [Planomonospora sp. ID67723]MBG0828116.1 O-antigen ligase family protein [Planomonospora sp. ID67723]